MFAYVGSIQNLKDLKDLKVCSRKRDPKAQMLSLQSFLREGRVVGPGWEKLKPRGPQGPIRSLSRYIVEGQLRTWSTGSDDVGLIQSTKAPPKFRLLQ